MESIESYLCLIQSIIWIALQYYVLLQVCIMFADAEAIEHDKYANVRNTNISHDERPTGT